MRNGRTASLPAAALLMYMTTLTGYAAPASQTPLSGLPPVADGQIYNSDWGRAHEEAASQRFTDILQRKFPVGSSEAILKQTLLGQGFKYPPPAQADCVPEKDVQSMPVGKTYVPCPYFDPNHHLRYIWTARELPPTMWPFCSQTVGVVWDAKDGLLTSITGYYGGDCA